MTATSDQSSTRASIDYATRVLPGQSPSVGLPVSTGQLVPAIDLLAWYARVPIGFEGLDDDPFASARVDPNNLLNRPVEALELRDVTLSEALHEVHFYLRPELRGRGIVGGGPGPRELGLRRFSVTVSRTTEKRALTRGDPRANRKR